MVVVGTLAVPYRSNQVRIASPGAADGSGSGLGVLGWEPGGTVGFFWGVRCQPRCLFFRGPKWCGLSAAAEAPRFLSRCARRLLGEGLRGLYYYLLSLRGEEKKKKKEETSIAGNSA